MTDTTDYEELGYHYVECHVIVRNDPEGNSLPHAKLEGWWGSRLNEDGSEEEEPGDLILTTRREEHGDAVKAIRSLAEKLRDVGYDVVRGKTEVVAFDTKMGDTF